MKYVLDTLACLQIAGWVLGLILVPFLFGRKRETEYTAVYWVLKYLVFGPLFALVPLHVLGLI